MYSYEAMAKVICFIDGFNLYHALDDHQEWCQYKWLNLRTLASHFVTGADSIEDVYFFTAVTQWSSEKTQRHQNYIKALESKGVKVVLGRFTERDIKCRLCGKTFKKIEEKQTDVNIAIKMLELAHANAYDTALLISADSDLSAAVQGVRSVFAEKQIKMIIPIGRRAEYLKSILGVGNYVKMKQIHLQTSMLENEICLPDGTILRNPYL